MRGSAYRRGHTQAQRSFAELPAANIQRSTFNRSNGLKTAFDAGYLVPIFTDEALPGDTFKLKMTSVIRFPTPALRPIMDNVFADFFFFAIPYRLVWSNWERFNGAQDDPGDSTDFLVPIMVEEVATGSLSDYLGIPIEIPDLEFVSLWHRAYNLVFREWFRSEDLQDSPVVDLDDGPDDPADYVLRRRGKRHDYFTSCLPFAQKGDPVVLPLGDTAPINRVSGADAWEVYIAGGDTQPGASSGLSHNASDQLVDVAANLLSFDPMGGLVTDLSGATNLTINLLRESMQLQELLEKDARGGTRYTEVIKTHFGVTSPDARLQRPEYLGGGTARLDFNQVPQTTPGATGKEVGVLQAFTHLIGGAGFMKSFTEHCLILGLVNVRADLTYQQGLARQFSRRTRYEFYWPSFARLGEQAVLQREIFVAGDSTDDLVFGYQERYAEYRYKPSMTTGLMRSQATGSLEVWHLGLDFASAPTLNDVFIEDDPPFDRVVAVPAQPHFIGDFFFDYRCARPMPVYGIPLSFGRF